MERWQRWLRLFVILSSGVLVVSYGLAENYLMAAFWDLFCLLWIVATWREYNSGEWYGEPTS